MSYLFLRFDALKGQQIIAQGFDVSSVERQRPGFMGEQRNRPRDDIYKSEIHVSDENDGLIFPENEVPQFPASGSLASEGNYLLCSSNFRGRFYFLFIHPGRHSFVVCPGLLYSALSGRLHSG